MSDPRRWAWAEVDLDAVSHNVATIARLVRPAQVIAVVKANGYGHGAAMVARTALDAGASLVAVALVQEGIELRHAGIDAPILVLSEQPESGAADLVTHDLTPTVYTGAGVRALVAAGAADLAVHVKIDTGMQRVGVQPHALAELLHTIAGAAPAVRLAGVYTHLPIADQPAEAFTSDQLDRFDAILTEHRLGDGIMVHAANSAGALAHPRARRDAVRLGIAMYGVSPGDQLDDCCRGLRPVMSVRARVSLVKRVRAGSRISYGLVHRFERDTTVATLPIGYADGVPRRLFAVGGSVLITGRRRPMVGVVTMDQLMVDCGDDAVAVGDEAVLIGRQGDEEIRAEQWARALDTIGYEIVCGISGRLPRVYHRRPDP